MKDNQRKAGCGKPCSGRRGKGRRRKCVADMDAGQTGRIEHVGEPICEKVAAMGVRPGKKMKCHSKHPLDGPVVITVGQSMTSLSRRYAQEIEVAVES